MVKYLKYKLLEQIPQHPFIEDSIYSARIFEYNDNVILPGSIIYLCERELRIKYNFALLFLKYLRQIYNFPAKIITPLQYFQTKLKQSFYNKQIDSLKKAYTKTEFDFEITDLTTQEIIEKFKPSILIIDFNPIAQRDYLNNVNFKIYEIDSRNIIPARIISQKQEYSAFTLRQKIYQNIYTFITKTTSYSDITTEADLVLDDFINNKLDYYFEYKNNPNKNVTSNLSKYLNLGFISKLEIVHKIVQSDASNLNIESFLEELIIRQELAENFCLYSGDFKSIKAAPSWAQSSLEYHKEDIRTFLYTLEEFENAQTHEALWNATQNQLRYTGKIHGYLRMYWAKKILEWTKSPQQALDFAIYLNDKYALDAPSPNGYVGILWAVAGLHDRAFQDYLITGKIRRMTYNSLKTKFDTEQYIKRYTSNAI